MPRHELLHLLASLNGLFFVFALGAIVGSFINVLAHRLPRGEDVVRPASACPHCRNTLRWFDNVPILAWLWLGGRCRFCKSRISLQYPLVECAVAALFALPWVLWFMDLNTTEHIGITRDVRRAIAPDWAHAFGQSTFGDTWPVFAVVLALLGSLAAATVIDAKTFTIPLVICWFMTGAGVVGHTAAAAFHAHGFAWSGHVYAVPAVSGGWLCAALLGAAGVGAANALLQTGVFPRSFSDFSEWAETTARAREEAVARGDVAPDAELDGAADGGPTPSVRSLIVRTVFLTGPAVAGMFLGFALARPAGLRAEGTALGAAAGLVVGVVLRNLAVRGERAEHGAGRTPGAGDGRGGGGGAHAADGPGLWLEYPHARREMLKELLFVAPIVVFAALGLWLGAPGGPLGGWFNGAVVEVGGGAGGPPLWLRALGGALMGYLVGGGVVWAVRILGTLAFDKEAMGLGDVHLMAGVGACLGWIDPLIAFFVAPFFGIAWALGSVFLSRVFRTSGAALPYGPHLAAATVAVLLAKPVFESGLSLILNHPVDLP